MAGRLTDILKDAMERSDALERENAILRDKLATIEGARREHGYLADLPDVLTVQEVAKFVRWKDNTVRELCHSGKLKYIGGGACGKTMRIMKSSLIDYLDEECARLPGRECGAENVVPMVIVNSRRKKKGVTA